uniref:ATP synthase complex subunit 8 n=2 Tax=Diestrammena asynamora TaxID=470930 RepID=A0A1Q1MPI1_9ORTH|nr:ATP synthase F0 subunit 8 [Diestrammena asynamora]AQM39996.1 ATP synthase F0 subunit 8 [Diestrammena asynamora]
MPQMAPISWLLLFIMFSMSLIMFCSMNYFISMPSTPLSSNEDISKNSLDWKW